MRYFLFFTALLLSTLACEEPESIPSVQECWNNRFEGFPIDYSTALYHARRSMLAVGHLQDTTGANYRALAEEVVRRNEFFFINMAVSPVLHEELRTCLLAAKDEPETVAYKLLAVLDSIGQLKDLTPATVMSPFLTSFSTEDWEDPLLQHYVVAVPYHLATQLRTQRHGILEKLPPWGEGDDPEKANLKARNVLTVLVNAENQILIRGEKRQLEEVAPLAKLFISNPNNDPEHAESPQKAIISLKNDRGTNYKAYLAVYNALHAAYEELWEASSQAQFGKSYEELPVEQKRSIRVAIPLIISEAEPTAF